MAGHEADGKFMVLVVNVAYVVGGAQQTDGQ